MRSDFTLFDEYEHRHASAPPFAFPVTAFWGSTDRRIKEHMVQVWLLWAGVPGWVMYGWVGLCGVVDVLADWQASLPCLHEARAALLPACPLGSGAAHTHPTARHAHASLLPALPALAGWLAPPRGGAASRQALSSSWRLRVTTCGPWRRPARQPGCP